LSDLLRWVAEDGGAAAGAWIGGDEGWAVDANWPFHSMAKVVSISSRWTGSGSPSPRCHRARLPLSFARTENLLWVRYFFTLHLFPGFSLLPPKIQIEFGRLTVTAMELSARNRCYKLQW